MTDFGRRVAVGPTTHEELCDALALLTPPGVCLDRATETELCDQIETLEPAAYCLGGPSMLPKTGQTASYRDGDDGYYESGWADGDRFTDNGDGTITDNATGLMWVQDPALGIGAPFNAGMGWDDAIINSEGLGFAEHSDWRLPNIHELRSITDFARYNPSANPLFTNIFIDQYWSSTTYFKDTGYAWIVHFYDGASAGGPKMLPIYYAWPVRNV